VRGDGRPRMGMAVSAYDVVVLVGIARSAFCAHALTTVVRARLHLNGRYLIYKMAPPPLCGVLVCVVNEWHRSQTQTW